MEVGYARTRLEEVARCAGVSRALVYTHFDNKEDLLSEVRNQALANWRAAVQPEIDRATHAAAKLRAMLHHTLLYARSQPLLQAILTDDVRVVVLGSASNARGPIDEWRRQVAEVLQHGVETGEFRSDLDVEHSADVIRAMQLGVIDRMHRPQGPIDVSREAHIHAGVELILRGVGAD